MLARRDSCHRVTLDRCNVLARSNQAQFGRPQRVMDGDGGHCATRRGRECDLRARRDVARRVHVRHRRLEAIVHHDAPFVVALTPQPLREVIGGVASDREEEQVAVELHSVLELERRSYLTEPGGSEYSSFIVARSASLRSRTRTRAVMMFAVSAV